jgi:hypothetical protein
MARGSDAIERSPTNGKRKMDDGNVVQLFPSIDARVQDENTEEFRGAVRVASAVIPFLVKSGQMTPLGADLKVVYREGEVDPKLLKQGLPLHYNRHELTVELRTFGGMVPVVPSSDLEPCPLCLEHLNMFSESCMLRVLEEGSCFSIVLWAQGMGWARHWEGPWVAEVLKAVGHKTEAT